MKGILNVVFGILILIQSLFILNSCKSDSLCDEWNSIHTELISLQPIYERNDWSIEDHQNGFWRIRAEEADTTWYSEVYCDHQEEIIDITLMKYFYEADSLHYIRFKKDTLYYYKSDTANFNKRFIVGKYEYLSTQPHELTSAQREFYRNHRDSMRTIRGDNLPEIPSR